MAGRWLVIPLVSRRSRPGWSDRALMSAPEYLGSIDEQYLAVWL
jgi:hypothetical protein